MKFLIIRNWHKKKFCLCEVQKTHEDSESDTKFSLISNRTNFQQQLTQDEEITSPTHPALSNTTLQGYSNN